MKKLHFHALVTDGNSANGICFVFLSNMQSVSLDKPYVASNPFDENRPRFLCSDPSHRLKVTLSVLRRSVVGPERVPTLSCLEDVCFYSDFLCVAPDVA